MKPPAIRQTPDQIFCEKCGSQMGPSKLFRFSVCLVSLGFFMAIPAAIGLILLALFGVLGFFGTGAAISSGWTSAQSNAVYRLGQIEGVPADYIALFRTNSLRASTELSKIVPDSAQSAARQVMHDYELARSSISTVGGAAGMLGGAFVLIPVAICIPIFIVGMLLVLRRKVWRCGHCGFIFDRA